MWNDNSKQRSKKYSVDPNSRMQVLVYDILGASTKDISEAQDRYKLTVLNQKRNPSYQRMRDMCVTACVRQFISDNSLDPQLLQLLHTTDKTADVTERKSIATDNVTDSDGTTIDVTEEVVD